MLQHLLEQSYGITIKEQFRVGHYEACRDENNLYLLMPILNMDNNSLTELENLSKHLVESGDSSVYQFLKSREGETIITKEQERYCVLSKPAASDKPVKRIGRKLAKLHYRGRTVPFQVKNLSRIGMWKTFWEQRLDQMERVWSEQLAQPPENDFERMFIESFPYYMGLAENAIQYLRDTELDEEPVDVDSGTICHERFQEGLWRDGATMKNPFHWVFDHCSRDLAEWTRDCYLHNIKTYGPKIRAFYEDYRSISTLSPFSWRLLYARLLFPLHYFESIEEYHIHSSEQQKRFQEERLKKYLDQSREYEEFLRDFFPLAGIPIQRTTIPAVEWLQR